MIKPRNLFSRNLTHKFQIGNYVVIFILKFIFKTIVLKKFKFARLIFSSHYGIYVLKILV